MAFDECKEIISNHWSKMPKSDPFSFGSKMASYMIKLNKWNNARLNGSIKSAIKRKENEIRNIFLSNDNFKDWKFKMTKKELDSFLEEEEIYWKFRPRTDWLRWDGKNTKWFHLKANLRKKRNKVKGFYNSEGVWVNDEEEMGKETTRYFSSLFSSSIPSNETMNDIMEGVFSKISKQQREEMDKPFTRADIEHVIKNMSPNKALGEDGAHATF